MKKFILFIVLICFMQNGFSQDLEISKRIYYNILYNRKDIRADIIARDIIKDIRIKYNSVNAQTILQYIQWKYRYKVQDLWSSTKLVDLLLSNTADCDIYSLIYKYLCEYTKCGSVDIVLTCDGTHAVVAYWISRQSFILFDPQLGWGQISPWYYNTNMLLLRLEKGHPNLPNVRIKVESGSQYYTVY